MQKQQRTNAPSARKLKLSGETLRVLTDGHLRGVVGRNYTPEGHGTSTCLNNYGPGHGTA